MRQLQNILCQHLFRVLFKMTSGELKFALRVEMALNTVPVPELRQLMVETLLVLYNLVEYRAVEHFGGCAINVEGSHFSTRGAKEVLFLIASFDAPSVQMPVFCQASPLGSPGIFDFLIFFPGDPSGLA